jgi:hypothetical protein
MGTQGCSSCSLTCTSEVGPNHAEWAACVADDTLVGRLNSASEVWPADNVITVQGMHAGLHSDWCCVAGMHLRRRAARTSP